MKHFIQTYLLSYAQLLDYTEVETGNAILSFPPSNVQDVEKENHTSKTENPR